MVELFSALYPAPCISGYARPPGPSAVIEHLGSLVPKGGLLLFLSHLPDDVKDGLGEMGPARATGPGMQQFVSSYFGGMMFLACLVVLIVDAVLQLSPLLGAVTVVSMTLLLLAFVLWLSSPGGLGTLGAALLTLAAGKPHV